MPSRIPNARRKRKRSIPPMVGGGKRTFTTRLTHGVQIERGYRRMYPLSDADLATISRTVKSDLKENQKGHDWVFVRFKVTVKGGIYQVESLFEDDEEDNWQEHWISTRAMPVSDKAALDDAVNDLLVKRMEGFTRGRPTWILRTETVVLKNVPRAPGKGT